MREHLETFLEAARERDGEGYPAFIEREFRRYLECGLLARGFARVRCEACGFERLVAFSCKGRLCPSCVGRRMADIAAYLVDDLLPAAPYRQWVLTFPWVLRFRLAVDRPLFSNLLGAFLRTVFAWQRRRGRALGIRDGQTGAVTFVQRFGGALNLNPHLHSLVPDGLFVPDGDGDAPLAFVPLPAPTTVEIEALTWKIARRLTAVVERRCSDECETAAMLERTVAALQDTLARAVEPPLPDSGLGLLGVDPPPAGTPLCAKVAGFSLHAARVVGAADRAGLERLCRYGLRAPFSQERLSLRGDGRVLYHLRRPWPNEHGVTCLLLEPAELLRRLAALVPAPYTNMVRYHGIFAGRSQWRARLPAPPRVEAESECGSRTEPEGDGAAAASPVGIDSESRPRRRPLPWAQLLKRVFFIDALTCPRCRQAMVVLALISDPQVVRKILQHLGLPADVPPVAPAAPPCRDEPLFKECIDGGAAPRSPP